MFPNVLLSVALAAALSLAAHPAVAQTSATPRHNDIAHLIERIQAGKVKLRYVEPRGYLDSLLKALGIHPESQVLVFSKTSLQTNAISAQTPRAIYFNDDTYVASAILEILRATKPDFSRISRADR